MTTPSETRDSELVAQAESLARTDVANRGPRHAGISDDDLCKALRHRAGLPGTCATDAYVMMQAEQRIKAIDRLTSTGEAVGWRWPHTNGGWNYWWGPTPPPYADGLEVKPQPLYAHPSPREGHVEDAEALRVAREVISDMVRYGHITTETGTSAYYVGENVLPTIMGRPLPHNQGETKP